MDLVDDAVGSATMVMGEVGRAARAAGASIEAVPALVAVAAEAVADAADDAIGVASRMELRRLLTLAAVLVLATVGLRTWRRRRAANHERDQLTDRRHAESPPATPHVVRSAVGD